MWRNEIARVVDLYDKLSRYEALDNGVTIVYGSMYGNTERMAEAAAEALAAAGVRDISVWNASHSDPSFIIADIFRHKGLVIASPTYSDGLFPAVETVMQAMATRKVKNRAVMLIGSNTWNQRAVAEMNRYLEICKLSPVAPPVVFKQAPGSDALANTIAAATELAHLL